MKRDEVQVAVLMIEGTNCDDEMLQAFRRMGTSAELVHLKQLLGQVVEKDRRRLEDYHVLAIPGGWSAGDYIRAGAIFAARMKAGLGKEVLQFVDSGKPVLGVCNGFQVLVELGLLPDVNNGEPLQARAVLNMNDSAMFECRPVLLKKMAGSNSPFVGRYQDGAVLQIPVAHAEGKLLFPADLSAAMVEKLEANGQCIFRYSDPSGEVTSEYPWNPNGAVHQLAGISNPGGNVLGMMPHPERSFYRWQQADWTRHGNPDGDGDGRALFDGILEYVESKF